MGKSILYKKGMFFRSLICKGRTFCTTSAVQVCGFGRNSFFQLANEKKRWIHSSEKENAATLPRFCTWQPGLSRSPQSTSVPAGKELDGITERRKSLKCCNAMPYSESCTKGQPQQCWFLSSKGWVKAGLFSKQHSHQEMQSPLQICFWERISNRITRRGRINREKSSSGWSESLQIFCCVMPCLMNRTMPLWAGTHLPPLSQPVMEGWELRHKYIHQGWRIPTANAMTTPFSLNYLQVGKVLLPLPVLYTGSFLPLILSKYTQVEWAAQSCWGCGSTGTHTSLGHILSGTWAKTPRAGSCSQH